MGVDNKIRDLFKWYDFNEAWDLLEPNKEATSDFLSSLDTYIYNSHPMFIENQSRAIVEASLNGLPIIAPNQYNFPNQIINKETGFLCDSVEEYKNYSKELENNFSLRKEMGKKASKIAREVWCDKNNQLEILEKIFSEITNG